MTISEPYHFADIAVALKLQADGLAESTENAEILAARIGLSGSAAARVIGERRRQAELVGAGHRLVKALIPFESVLKMMLRRRV
jgi:hypothetical protein